MTGAALEAVRSVPVAAMGAPAVSVRGLSKAFASRRAVKDLFLHPFRSERVKALSDVTFNIANGEFFGLLGPNGAGKTTLFKILATLITPDTGQVSVNGFDAVREAAAVRRIMTPVIADERSLRWRLSAYENVRLFAVLYGLPPALVKSRSEEVLAVVGLQDTGRKLVGQFSSGMKQRVMIARALLPRPRILLLDEPTRGLDPLSARELRKFLREVVCGQQGCTILLATHNTEEAFDLCDRVAVMNKGRILVTGPTADLVAEYGDDRYRVFTRTPAHPAFRLAAPSGSEPTIGSVDADGWTSVELSLPGGGESAERVLRQLVLQDVSISRFERVPLSLADLIGRVLHREGEAERA
ncbi:MAG: ABC transporter ATP-binding protein [Acidobacteriota bacterium]